MAPEKQSADKEAPVDLGAPEPEAREVGPRDDERASISREDLSGESARSLPEADALAAQVFSPEGASDEARGKADEPILAPAAASAPKRARGGFLPALFGGVLAFGGGFAASHFDVLPLASTEKTVDVTRYDAALAEQRAALGALQADLAAINQKTQQLSSLSKDSTAALGQRLEDLDARFVAQARVAPEGGVSPAALAEVARQVADLAAKPAGAGLSSADISALVDQALDARAEDLRAETEAQAEALRRELRYEQGVAALAAALRDGTPYEAALTDLGSVSLPEVLRQNAVTGIPSLHDLTASFPEAARAGLEAALRAAPETGFGDRLWSFLRVSVGARALSPQDGDDPDAVLSRAEAALTKGDLATVLGEIATLPPAGQAAMDGWTAQARLLREAGDALATLTK